MVSVNYFKTILVPLDGSPRCLQAEEVAARIAQQFRSRVSVVHVIPYELLEVWSTQRYPIPSSIREEIRDALLQQGNKIVRDAEALFNEEGVDVEARLIQYEDPAETLLGLAEAEGHDLIVMGSHGETAVEDHSLGSIAKKVSRHAECPVLLVKQSTSLSKILVGVDGSEHAAKALQYAVQLATKQGSELTVMHVQESHMFRLHPDVVSQMGQGVLDEVKAAWNDIEFDTKVESGDPAAVIIDVAVKEAYDLIVVGSRGLSGVKRFLLGSVSDDITHHAETSVLVVR
jgi:nucleotide-binding universal stress UspA family protein